MLVEDGGTEYVYKKNARRVLDEDEGIEFACQKDTKEVCVMRMEEWRVSVINKQKKSI